VLKSALFDYVFIETVGVGQSELEIASLADTTVVVFVPESGDDIQTIKSGIMEIADIFVVNKSDREGADKLVKNLQSTLHERTFKGWEIPVIKTIANTKEGSVALFEAINRHHFHKEKHVASKSLLLAKAIHLATSHLIRKIDLPLFQQNLETAASEPDFNIYRFITNWFHQK